MDLSIVTSARNKDYGSDPSKGGRVFTGGLPFVDRFGLAVSHNLDLLARTDINAEWIIVDWCSPGDPLCMVDQLKPIFADRRVRTIIVGESVARAEGLIPATGFFEHFAKNVGIRRAAGRYVLILNGDVMLSEELLAAVVAQSVVDDDQHFFRPSLHRDLHPQTRDVIRTSHLDDRRCPDWMVSANYGGNFLMVSRTTMLSVAQGFDEVSPIHRNEYWHRSGMDGEILWQMHRQGVTLQHLPGAYDHLFHGKPPEGMSYNQDGYQNRADWGLINYATVEENGALRISACQKQ